LFRFVYTQKKGSSSSGPQKQSFIYSPRAVAVRASGESKRAPLCVVFDAGTTPLARPSSGRSCLKKLAALARPFSLRVL
jgi:hypothetical protein